MIERKFNWKVYTFIVFFSFVLFMAGKAVYMLLGGQVTDESGKTLNGALAIIPSILIIIVCSTYLLTVLSLLKNVLKYKGKAFTIDEKGIHNTLTFINFFAFIFVLPIKFIPWSAVSYVDMSGGPMYIRVKVKECKMSLLAKLVVSIKGYAFCYSFKKGNLKENEICFIMQNIAQQSKHISQNNNV